MVDKNETPLPVEAVRDLLGIARALYGAMVEMGPAYDKQRWELRGIGNHLTLAIEKAARGGPGTWDQKTAWLIAEKAAADLIALVDVYFPARNLLRAASERLSKKR